MTGSTRAADGTRIVFDDRGAGTPLLLVHGWCSDRRSWDDMVEALGPGRRVLAVDRRGHGDSDAPPDGYTIDGHAGDLLAVLDTASVDRAVVVAHAGGAPGAMEFVHRHPDRVLGLVLVDTMLRDGPVRAAPGEPEPLERLAAMLAEPDGDTAFTEMYRGFFADPDSPAAHRAIGIASTVPHHVRGAELLGIGVDTVAICSTISVPVLWVHVGELDPRVTDTFRDVESVHVDDAGHFVQIDAPVRLADLIEDFLRRRCAAA